MKKKNHPFIYFTILVLIFTFCGRNVSAQNISKNEQIEQVLAYWQHMQHFVKKKLALSKEENIAFFRFYSASIDSDNIIFTRQVRSGALNMANVENYIDNIVNKYVNKYSQFEAIKKEYPSTISEYSSPLKSPQNTCNPACDNIGFESGTLSGWNAYYAQNNSVSSFSFSAPVGGPCGAVTGAANDPTTNVSSAAHDYQVEIMTGGTDQVVPSVPRVSPFGGSYSVRLGDSTNPNQGMAILNQTFQVTPANAAFTYQYALFLENPNHHYTEQPFFRVTFLDQNGDTIKCITQFIISGSNIGFKAVYYPADADSVYYKNWTSVLAPLNHYIGQCVTVQFEVADCSLGGHFGYAYIDAACNPMTITQSSPVLCSKSNIMLTAPAGAGSYTWSGPKNGIVGSNATQSINIDTAGVYSLIITNPFSGSCHDTIYDTVKGTSTLPTIAITSSPANDTVCPGSPVTLSGNGAKTYSWSGGIINGTPFMPASTTTYFVTGTDTNGCSNTDSVIVTVDGHAITITASPANGIVCAGNSITLSANGGTGYVWSGGITNGTPFVPVSSGEYVVTGTNANNCSNKDSIHVTIDSTVITITSTPVNDTVCPGGQITLSGNGGTGYTWTGGVTDGVPFSPVSSGKYVVTGTDANGCSNKDSVNVIAGSGSLPTITATSSPVTDTICMGSTITLSGNGGNSYTWSGGVKNGVAFAPSASGSYIVTGTGPNGCSNNDTVKVVVNPLPVINITGQTPIISGTKDTLTATGGVSFAWSTGSTNDTTIVAPTTATKYVVTVTNANGCQDTASFTVTIKTITGISTVTNETGTNLFPNPASEILNLTFNTNGKAIAAVIKIADVSGKQWIETNANLNGNQTISIDISRLSAGMYFVQIETSTSVKTIKFIKN